MKFSLSIQLIIEYFIKIKVWPVLKTNSVGQKLFLCLTEMATIDYMPPLIDRCAPFLFLNLST